ncbi:MAG: NADH dehydrogenase subunit D, partial [Saccharomonospora viridis]
MTTSDRIADVNTDTDTPAENGDGADGARYAEHRDTTEGRVYTVGGGDWDDVLADATKSERMIINMGPQHPSTHGVLRLVLEMEGETVTQLRSVIGYLHTGIEKNCEYR